MKNASYAALVVAAMALSALPTAAADDWDPGLWPWWACPNGSLVCSIPDDAQTFVIPPSGDDDDDDDDNGHGNDEGGCDPSNPGKKPGC